MLITSFNLLRRLTPALVLAGMIICLSVGELQLTAQSQQIPMTGVAVPGMESFDRLLIYLLSTYNVPGAELAVVKDGRLVYARGYGLADREANQPIQPDSLMRIMSISKSITAVAVLKLVEEGKLDLDAKVFCPTGASCLLGHLQPPPNAFVDTRIYDITVRQLLHHAAGWDRSRSPDWMSTATNREAALALGVTPPASAEIVIRYVMTKPLDFTPGTGFAYSNFGYVVLGRVIEKVTGQSYENFVKTALLTPAGIKRMQIGHTLLEGRVEGEVRYYDYPGAPLRPSLFPPHDLVYAPYGGTTYLEGADAPSGWIASAIDLVRFETSLEGRRQPALLKPETVNLMISRPAALH